MARSRFWPTATWTYTLNNEHAAVQALSAGAALSDTITVIVGRWQRQPGITITITGANDGARSPAMSQAR